MLKLRNFQVSPSFYEEETREGILVPASTKQIWAVELDLLIAMKYPELDIPFKIPMPRPVDTIFKDWAGPNRGDYFRKDIPMDKLTGNQKWQLWCAEKFLQQLR